MALEPIDLFPRFAFWRDGCRTMATNICEVLRRAGEPITRENIVAFVTTLPRDVGYLATEMWQAGYCGSCLRKAYANAPPAEQGEKAGPLLDYFLGYFTERSGACQSMLIDAFIGILNGIPLER